MTDEAAFVKTMLFRKLNSHFSSNEIKRKT